MANAVNYLAQIQTGQTIQAVHVNQFVDALSGSQAYDLVTSGSYRIIGPLYATASWATNALNSKTADSGSKTYIASNASTNIDYTLVFKNSAGALGDYYQLAADGTNGPYYNPSTNVLGGLGGLTMSGSIGRFTSITGSLSGSVTGNVTGTASFATSASYATISDTATSTGQVSGYYVPSGSAVGIAGLLKMFAGAGKTSTGFPFTSVVIVTPLDLTGKTLNQNLFLGIAPSQSNARVSVILSSPSSITFESDVASTDFTFVATYI
jgi:hypothetical protein